MLIPLGFVLYCVAALAEVNRAPFDLPEAEQELVAGYLTEYSGLRWSLYQMAEYINMITVSAVVSTVFLGGWSFFGLESIPVLSLVFFLVKVAFFLFLFIWLRATLPRIRYDRLMRLGWETLLPLAVLNVVITAVCVTFGLHWVFNTLASLLAGYQGSHNGPVGIQPCGYICRSDTNFARWTIGFSGSTQNEENTFSCTTIVPWTAQWEKTLTIVCGVKLSELEEVTERGDECI